MKPLKLLWGWHYLHKPLGLISRTIEKDSDLPQFKNRCMKTAETLVLHILYIISILMCHNRETIQIWKKELQTTEQVIKNKGISWAYVVCLFDICRKSS
ncbi:uncharacterized protein isoform X2 [Leptinotarsa decemlineata]|uniref:uncharacterized protein isoform X2 n=1 Tax=Leptinotarsa decemlineata TaxID=7539 RepID=UPI003D3051EC